MLDFYILVALILFFIGVLGVILRKNIFTIFMSVELMLNAMALIFATFARQSLNLDGQVIVMLIIAIAAAEASFGLALIVLLYKKKQSLNIDIFDELKDRDVS
ncbi:NADH-quinone oxidoreductase subunit NuoK [Campylobacter fetus]|uniref:NADH-quinone oxidoreductase subunit NuoK n=1 Tax=Campylobacter fetus TaxID=196 RepID=UPI000508E3A0|nr:NADH-quinone oxidoreductase subunit NuoK [Campylobacter fetus]WKW17529.1 NADH-quinone oxidoreductase subunit NuoK [Campylobacter fetus subsp. fetus]AIR78120.1 NADH:quinone oxidoreductase I, membrane subunit K [Campylobacter fetus subsp. fetus 04/554]EAJ5694148.1 NADH-quinone oxidoreductase subunit NuoK [Campylobacter fetus]EAJ5704756.1 NADH-quinone oxidoreductase subunit NuoK [Campylobacter fetus]EAJ9257561.1 NADH-quinone oxidoreductase subunit NuoK [Campylobacter fetus]